MGRGSKLGLALAMAGVFALTPALTAVTHAQGCTLPSDPAQQPFDCGGNFAGAFNMPIPAQAPSDPQSAQIVGTLTSSGGQVTASPQNSMLWDMMQPTGRIALDEGVGVWIVNDSDPSTYTVRTIHIIPGDGTETTFTFAIPTNAAPAGPPYIQPPPSSGGEPDAPMLVYDPNPPAAATPPLSCLSAYGPTTALRLFQARFNSDGSISATGYGIFQYGASFDGLPLCGTGTGSGLPWVGLIRGSDFTSGAINHALRIAGPVASSEFRPPAITSDCNGSSCANGVSASATKLQEGMRFQLDQSVDCESRTVPWDRTGTDQTDPTVKLLHEICKALQEYGAIVVDGSASSTQYIMEMESNSNPAFEYHAGGTFDWSQALGTSFVGGSSYPYWGEIIRDANAVGDQYSPAGGCSGSLCRTSTDGIPWNELHLLAPMYTTSFSAPCLVGPGSLNYATNLAFTLSLFGQTSFVTSGQTVSPSTTLDITGPPSLSNFAAALGASFTSMTPTHIPLNATNASPASSDFTLTSNPLAPIVANEPLSNPGLTGTYSPWSITSGSGTNGVTINSTKGAVQITWYGVDAHGNHAFGPVPIVCSAPSSAPQLASIPIGSP